MDTLNKYLEFELISVGEYKVKGKELIIKKCPYCGKEKKKFYINTEKGLYQCFSGSCRATGHIHRLYGKFNVSMPDMRFKSKNLDLKTYVKVLSEDCIKFLNDRGISKKVIDNNIFDIASTSDNKISFIYRKHFEVHSIKVRDIKEKSFLGKKLKE